MRKVKPVGAFIPINEWELLQNKIEKMTDARKKSKSMIWESIKNGLKEVELIEKGSLKPVSIKELLNEL